MDRGTSHRRHKKHIKFCASCAFCGYIPLHSRVLQHSLKRRGIPFPASALFFRIGQHALTCGPTLCRPTRRYTARTTDLRCMAFAEALTYWAPTNPTIEYRKGDSDESSCSTDFLSAVRDSRPGRIGGAARTSYDSDTLWPCQRLDRSPVALGGHHGAAPGDGRVAGYRDGRGRRGRPSRTSPPARHAEAPK